MLSFKFLLLNGFCTGWRCKTFFLITSLSVDKKQILFVASPFLINILSSLKIVVMANKNLKSPTNRRGFLGSLATGAAAVGLATFAPSLPLHAEGITHFNEDDPDAWFNKVKGKHKIMYDVTRPNEVFPFAWPRVFLLTNEKTGTPASDCGVVVVLRHDGIAYAFDDNTWGKYKFGEMFKADDPVSKTPATRNPFWKPKAGDFKVPGIGNVQIGINELQESGVMFCVCDMAISVFTSITAGAMKKDPAEVKKDWLSGLLPGIQVVPSGVWAVGRAQEHGCAYCFAG
jgi:intracellular sulfur oxidation DsrE/DsrF family protein